MTIRSAARYAVPAFALLFFCGAFPTHGRCSDQPTSDIPDQKTPPEEPISDPHAEEESAERVGPSDSTGEIRFSFKATAWRDVLTWIADEAGLALHYSDLPTGTFSYSDPTSFSAESAIDRINLFLLSDGYTLVRSGGLLTLVNLADPRGVQKLTILARLVSPAELDGANTYDVVKCIFPLNDVRASDAVQELQALNLMVAPTILSKTNQILVVDTVAKLRSVRRILDSFQPESSPENFVVRSFPLKHVSADDVLAVARPHLGLSADEMVGIDISLSTDLQGRNLFVTGPQERVMMVEQLIQSIDLPDDRSGDRSGDLVLQSHVVAGGNVETVHRVLQTMLAGQQNIRLSMDSTANSIVALADAQVQREIAATVSQLEADEADFEVIELRGVDPFLAVSLVDQMLDLSAPLGKGETRPADAPRIDADAKGTRLFVRARRPQLEQIRKIVKGLEPASSRQERADFRVLAFSGPRAESLVRTVARFWGEPNPISLYRDEKPISLPAVERVPTEEQGRPSESDLRETSGKVTDPERLAGTGAPEILTTKNDSLAEMIRCQITPQGLLVQSVDTQALDRFEQQLMLLAGPTETTSPVGNPVVFYLRHTRPDEALRMLRELIDGGGLGTDRPSGTASDGLVSSSRGLFSMSSVVTSNEGTTTMMAGTITVVADSRLNRLIAQGTDADIDRIEGYLKIIDRDSSITNVETYGTAQVIELVNTRASEVAEAIKEAFANRLITSKADMNRQEPAKTAAKGSDADQKSAIKPTTTPRDLEPKLAVAVHEASNSLIVTAPPALFSEVQSLVKSIDQRGEQAISVVAPSSSAAFGAVLEQLAGESTTSGRSRTRSSSR